MRHEFYYCTDAGRITRNRAAAGGRPWNSTRRRHNRSYLHRSGNSTPPVPAVISARPLLSVTFVFVIFVKYFLLLLLPRIRYFVVIGVP